MYLRLTPNLLHFLPNLDGLYALRPTPNFYEIHPKTAIVKKLPVNLVLVLNLLKNVVIF
jgi:hypothetical protein